jgi:hypothetical protein
MHLKVFVFLHYLRNSDRIENKLRSAVALSIAGEEVAYGNLATALKPNLTFP